MRLAAHHLPLLVGHVGLATERSTPNFVVPCLLDCCCKMLVKEPQGRVMSYITSYSVTVWRVLPETATGNRNEHNSAGPSPQRGGSRERA